MRLAQFRNLLFDFDGTLVDSSPLHAEAFRDVLALERPELAAIFSYEPLKGLTTREAFCRLGVADEPQLGRCVAGKQARYREFVTAGRLTLLPGAGELLRDAAHSGRRLFLVTSGSAASVRLALTALGLADRFEGVVTSDDVRAGKPAPEAYLYCLSRHELEPAASVAIEDAASGAAAAREAGLAVVGVNDPQVASLADWFFADLPALGAAIACTGSEEA